MFDTLEQARLDSLHFKFDEASQLRAIIAIHNTKLGPALGGCRCLEYPSDNDAIEDAIRLAKGMSYKAALAHVPHGGGKAVIIKPPELTNRIELYRAFGRFVEQLGGRYITAIDSGTTLADMDAVCEETPFAAGSNRDGLDPSPVTALGVFSGMLAAVECKLGVHSLSGLRVAIQGLGNVGYELAKKLYAAGAHLLVTDIDPLKIERCVSEFNATPVNPEEIFEVQCEIFSPCGLGAVINDQTIDKFQCQIIAGSANNQLGKAQHGNFLHQRGILYAPDYVINAGGLINVSLGNLDVDKAHIIEKTSTIGLTLKSIFERSQLRNTPCHNIADHMAEEILYH